MQKFSCATSHRKEKIMTNIKKVFIGVGHGGKDSGAVGYIVEKDTNLVMAMACKEYLEANSVVVGISRTTDANDAIAEEIGECNAFNPDVAIDCHNNAGGGDGFEVLHSINANGKGKQLATYIEEEVKKLGQNSRGLKTRKNSSGKDYFGFIRETNCPAVICEGVFVDNRNDVKVADTVAEQKAFGYAYARGILRYLGISTNKKPSNPSPAGSFLIRLKVDSLSIRSGAGAEKTYLGAIKDKKLYTIVETKKAKDGGTWGKLKSGAGWINVGNKYVIRV